MKTAGFISKGINLLFAPLAIILTAQSVVASTNNYASTIKKINQSFTTSCRAHKFSGVILIAIDGKVKLKKACGLASRDFNVPNNVNTKFNLGSIGKLFTIVSIAQLIEAKKLSLHTHAFKIIPSWLPMKYGKKITVGQLLIHASGLSNFMANKRWELEADDGMFNRVIDYKPIVSSEKLLFKPGTSQFYSNSGYVALGAIVEKLSKEPYTQYIKQHIFNVANMPDTRLYALNEIVHNRSVGYYYSRKRHRWENNNYQAPFIGSPAGGAYSTVEDLFRFSQALYHNKLLNPTLTKEVLSSHIIKVSSDIHIKPFKIGKLLIPENMSPFGFAGAWNKFGFAVWKHSGLVGHNGGTIGASALLAMSPENKYTIILLSNKRPGEIPMYHKIRDAFGFKTPIENY